MTKIPTRQLPKVIFLKKTNKLENNQTKKFNLLKILL